MEIEALIVSFAFLSRFYEPLLYGRRILFCLSNPPPINTFAHALLSVTPSISTTGFLRRGKLTVNPVMYDLSLRITIRPAIPAYSYRHGLNFIPGIVKTRIHCYSGITYPSPIVMAPGYLLDCALV